MRVLFAASEGVPFIKTGGLGDVIGSLPKQLKKKGIAVGIVMPLYSDIALEYKKEMTLLKELQIPLAWRKKYCGIKKLTVSGLPFYFIDNEYYFKRNGLYGFADDAERFAFFSKAVLEAVKYLDFQPQIIHCHDWQTAVVSLFLHSHYRDKPLYQDLKTILTIHNLQYQGVFPHQVLPDVLGLGEQYFTEDKVEFYGGVNYLKAGLIYSDFLTTVSETYASEIQTPAFGEKLDGVLRKRKGDLVGIINGIDDSEKKLAANILQKKRAAKKQLQNTINLPEKEGVPLVGFVSRLVKQKGIDLIQDIYEELISLDLQLVVLGNGEERYENFFRTLSRQFPEKVSATISFNSSLASLIYEGSDLFLMPSLFEPCGLSQLLALRAGSIPIVRETGGLKDTIQPFDENTKKGNGFTFRNYNAQELLSAVKRALSFYYQKETWHKIMQNAIGMDYSWEKSAQKYLEIYQKLLN